MYAEFHHDDDGFIRPSFIHAIRRRRHIRRLARFGNRSYALDKHYTPGRVGGCGDVRRKPVTTAYNIMIRRVRETFWKLFTATAGGLFREIPGESRKPTYQISRPSYKKKKIPRFPHVKVISYVAQY